MRRDIVTKQTTGIVPIIYHLNTTYTYTIQTTHAT